MIRVIDYFCENCGKEWLRTTMVQSQCECSSPYLSYRRGCVENYDALTTAIYDDDTACWEQVVSDEEYNSCPATIYGVKFKKNWGFIERNVLDYSTGVARTPQGVEIKIEEYIESREIGVDFQGDLSV